MRVAAGDDDLPVAQFACVHIFLRPSWLHVTSPHLPPVDLRQGLERQLLNSILVKDWFLMRVNFFLGCPHTVDTSLSSAESAMAGGVTRRKFLEGADAAIAGIAMLDSGSQL